MAVSSRDSEDLAAVESSFDEGLSQVPFSELQKVQEKIGTKQFSALLSSSIQPRHRVTHSTAASKGRPLEMTSKQPVSWTRQVVPVRRQHAVDPRFSDEYGQYDEGKFNKAYQFLDGVRQNERDAVSKELKQAKSESRRTQLAELLKHIEATEKVQKKKAEEKQLSREHNKIEQRLRLKGKRPFFIKKSLSKKIALAQKYKALKREGKLERYMEKKRKKNVQRDRKSFPSAKT